MKQNGLPQHRARLRKLLDEEGIRSALIYLNGLTEHRFTALYRFVGATLKKSFSYDRQNPDDDYCPDIPIEASYCVFIEKTGRDFTTPNSIADGRLSNHPKQKEILSYCGVPLVAEDGKMFGSVCHFDLERMPIEADMVDLMEGLFIMIMEKPELISQ